jgi:hypothetical protein
MGSHWCVLLAESSLFVWGASVVLGLLCGFIGLVVKAWLIARNSPDPERRAGLLAAVNRMRSEGRPYAERLAYLQNEGLRRDVADALLGEAERTVLPDR